MNDVFGTRKAPTAEAAADKGETPPIDLASLVRSAWHAGQSIDLGSAVYGRAVRNGAEVVIDRPSTYYPFLAGLIRTIDAKLVLEIGTNCGGSALAMRSGFEAGGQVITIDVTDHSDPYLAGVPDIEKVQGDANTVEVAERVASVVAGREVDLLYIDAAHSCEPTLLNYCIYGALLMPRLVAIDDITLYPSMERLWRLLQATAGPGRAIDAATIIPAIRPQVPAPGFGIVAFRPGSFTTKHASAAEPQRERMRRET